MDAPEDAEARALEALIVLACLGEGGPRGPAAAASRGEVGGERIPFWWPDPGFGPDGGAEPAAA